MKYILDKIVSNYLRYGCSRPFPIVQNIKKSDLSFEETKQRLLEITETVIKENIIDPNKYIFQCSGGFDTSVIISYFRKISTFCRCKTTMSDYNFSFKVSEYFNTNHEYLSEEELTKDVDIEKCLLFMNKIHSYPRGYTNDLGLYLFVKYIKEKTDTVVGGEGIELMYLGYIGMFFPVLQQSVLNGDYKTTKARL